MPRRCAFCQGPAKGSSKSNEHILPGWLQRHLSLPHELMRTVLYDTSGGIDDQREHPFSRQVTGFVCRSCNTGWLSELENQAKVSLVPLIDGDFTGRITGEQCHTIACWVFKTVLTLQTASQRARLVPPEHYYALYERRAIAAGVSISIAHCAQSDVFWSQKRGLPLLPHVEVTEEIKADFKETYRITLEIGHLVARVWYWPLQGYQLFDRLADIIRRVTHVGEEGVSWPPAHSIENAYEFDSSLCVTGVVDPDVQTLLDRSVRESDS